MTTRSEKVEVVRQKEIALLNRLRLRVEALEAELREARAEEAGAALILTTRLQAGAEVERGPLTASVEMRDGSVRPPWKKIHLDHMLEEHGVAPEAAEEAARGDHPASRSAHLVIGVRTVSRSPSPVSRRRAA